MLKEGDKAPDFTLEGIDEEGSVQTFSLKDFKGKKIVLYFYPKDNTTGCTKEACDFRDNMGRLKGSAIILGVSPDSMRSHTGFREKHGLQFPLLSDPEKNVALAYGAYGEKKMYGKMVRGIIRSTFVIDEKGLISHIWHDVKVQGHVDEVMKAVKE